VIFKTNIKLELDRLLNDLSQVVSVFNSMNQLAIVYDPKKVIDGHEPHFSAIGKSPIDIDEWNLTEVCPIFKNTYLEEVIDIIPYQKQRIRLMRMLPKTTYSMHVDTYKRLHWALITDPSCHLTFQSNAKFFGWHIPADGFGYLADTTKMHSAVNPWDQIRYHLVIDIKE